MHPARPALLGSLLLALACNAMAQPIDKLRAMVDRGEYSQAREALGAAPDDAALAFELERMRRIEMEFNRDRAEVAQQIRRYLPDASDADIAQWDRKGLLEHKVIDGEKRYFRSAARNLLYVRPDLAARSPDFVPFAEGTALYQPDPHHSTVMRDPGAAVQRFEADYTLSVDADAVPAGETVRAWLPYPKHLPGQQENIELLHSSGGMLPLPVSEAPQHTAYFEQEARAGEPTVFRISYAWDSLPRFTAISSAAVKPVEATPALRPWLAERPPHIVFSDDLRALSARIVGLERNPYLVARRLFAWVDDIPWASAREYSTIRDISHYAATAGHADCGQQTLLLITLLRMNGIPARWQSGWEFAPDGFDTMHDWGEFYLEPYGWLPMDVTHGRLGEDSDPRHWFYLGGLDAYRLVFNSDYSRALVPAKQHFRSETVDSQRGEVEWRGGNLYFDQWDYQMEWRRVPRQAGDS